MAKPQITIRSQVRLDKTITVTGVITGNPTSITIDLPAAAVPAGAITRPQGFVALNVANEFSFAFTSCPYGFYDSPKIVATNADGVTTVFGWPIQLFAPATAPVGTARALLPDFVAPVFTQAAIALNAVITDFTLESTSPTDQVNVPFTFGQPFKSGDLAPGDFLVGRIAGQADIPLQFNFKASHQNGSVRHAVISGVMPNLTAGTSKTVQIVRASSGTSTVPLPSKTISDAGFTAGITINIAGVDYSADATAALAAGLDNKQAWLSGAIVNDWTIALPFKKADGVAHPTITAHFYVRYYAGTGKAKVDFCVEDTKAYSSTVGSSYLGTVTMGGKTVLSVTALDGTPLLHNPCGRWKRTIWWNHASPVHVKYNVPYLIGSKQLPNYDQRIVVPETELQGYATATTGPKFWFMGTGLVPGDFTGTGGRPDIGIAPEWYVAAVLSQDKRAYKLMLAQADCAGTWGTHRRDESTGPASGLPIDIIHFPRSTILGAGSDSKNTATGGYEKFPARSNGVAGLSPDTSHQPSFAYLPYLLTGDFYYLEELQFWCNYNHYNANPGGLYRAAQLGLLKPEQVRGQAWSMRTLGQTSAITPDAHPAKPRFNYILQNNLSYYNTQYTDNPDANQLHIIVNGPALVYNEIGATSNGIANFMEDFFMQSIGVVAELGYPDAQRFGRWKAKWQVERMIGVGACYTHACRYSPAVRDTSTSPFYTTIAEVFAKNLPEYANLACGSQARVDYMNATRNLPSDPFLLGDMAGYPKSTEGLVANLQPALAYAVDVGYPDADLAWTLFDARPSKPNYGKGPQFAVVPRGYTAPEAPPPPPPGTTDPGTPPPPPPPSEPLPFDVYVEININVMFIGKNSA